LGIQLSRKINRRIEGYGSSLRSLIHELSKVHPENDPIENVLFRGGSLSS
jgi:hypothetical protein